MIIQKSLESLLASHDLSFADARLAMDEIMSGKVSPVLLAAWLVALRMKGENAAELGGCAASMAEHASPVVCDDPRVIDIVGTGGDRAHTHNFSTMAALVAAGCGVTVAKHGNRAVSSQSGAADVLHELGVRIELSPDDMAQCLKEVGMAFLFAPCLHPAMKYAMPVRRELGIRTVFNVLGPLTNPAGTKHMVIGVYAVDLCPLIAEACLELGKEHVMVVHGHGLDELSTLGPNRICELRNGKIRDYIFDATDLGLARSKPEELRGGSPAENAAMVRDILSGKGSRAIRDMVLLNAAGGLIAAGSTAEWPEALLMAAESIDSGKAMKHLEAMIAFTASRD